MNELKTTINYEPYEHMVYHFVLTYSNWESITLCSSESFENLSDGLQNALWELTGVPIEHLTDSLSAAVKKLRGGGKEFTDRYQALLTQYGLIGRHTEPVSPEQNGDVEARNRRLKECVDQALMLRGSRDFPSVDEYEQFLRMLIKRMNAGRQKRLNEELPLLKPLPSGRLDSIKCDYPRVGQGSTISIQSNVYSVPSRLIGEIVEARISGKTIQVWYAQKKIDEFPRFRGRGYARIDYRHIIDVLVKKPGAFAHYRYREELFPTHYYRMAYDALVGLSVKKRSREYLRMLQLAAHHGEIKVQQAIISIIDSTEVLTAANVETLVCATNACIIPLTPHVACADLQQYEALYRIPGGLQ
jgi:transposase InsO family protein